MSQQLNLWVNTYQSDEDSSLKGQFTSINFGLNSKVLLTKFAFAKDLAKARDNITIVSFDNFKDLDQAYKLVKANDPDKWNKFFGKEVVVAPFDWVIWDTWSEIQWYMLQKLRENENIAGTGLDYRKNLQIIGIF